MTPQRAHELLERVTLRWVADPRSDVEWAGPFENRWGIRLVQRVRDKTTMWFDVGDLTVGYEAYLLPDPPLGKEAVYRYCLARNATAWPSSISVDRDGDLYVRGRIPLAEFDEEALDRAVGSVYEIVELSFRTLVRLGFSPREKS